MELRAGEAREFRQERKVARVREAVGVGREEPTPEIVCMQSCLGKGLATWAGQERAGREREAPRSLGCRREGSDFHQDQIQGQL